MGKHVILVYIRSIDDHPTIKLMLISYTTIELALKLALTPMGFGEERSDGACKRVVRGVAP